MTEVPTFFMLLAGVVFLGYMLNALFYKLKISSVLPLLIIGVLIGPVFHIVDTSPTSVIVQISPFVTAVAIAFVLFDVGMGIRLASLKSILLKSSKFTIVVSLLTGAIMSAILYYTQNWGVLVSLMGGFAVSGTSSIILPSLLRVIKVSGNLKTSFAYQSVFNDVFSFVVPLIFFNILATGAYSTSFVASELVRFLVGSIILGLFFASFWIFILKTFKKYSSEYSWMLTLTMVLAVYGVSELANFNGALSAFIFGILLTNIPDMKFVVKSYVRPVINDIAHIKFYQKEITFFVSTFFFVYIGMLFDTQGVQYLLVGIVILMAAIMLAVRRFASGILKGIISSGRHEKSERVINVFYIAQGLPPAIIATLPSTIGLTIPNFVNIMFLVILVTNAVLSIGLYKYAEAFAKESRSGPEKSVLQDKQQLKLPTK
ncbi:MAG: cation:proton antiporter [Candidatus Micrarchaeota archaeon]|nr:cation:proton antiporter [Candidatus Micrarchaeota archaeon]